MTLTPKEYAQAGKVGLLFCENEHGERVTLATADLEYWKLLRDAPSAARAGLEIPPGKFPVRRAGWPDEWGEQWPSLEALGEEIAAAIERAEKGD